MDDHTQASFDTVMAFMGATGCGDMAKMDALMADDMVWHNEGDATLPWIGETRGKANIFDFLGVFSSNLPTTKWTNTDAFASGDTVTVFGEMAATATKTGRSAGDFTFAQRAKVRGGQGVLWHWFEDSFAVSQAYHGSSPHPPSQPGPNWTLRRFALHRQRERARLPQMSICPSRTGLYRVASAPFLLGPSPRHAF